MNFLIRCSILCAFVLIYNWTYASAQDSISKPNKKLVQIEVTIDSIGSPVIANNDTLFYIRHSLGPISIYKRAQNISERLTKASFEFNSKTDSIYFVAHSDVATVLWNDTELLEITALESELQNSTLTKLTKNWTNKIDQNFRSRLTKKETLFQYGVSLAIIFTTLLIINFILKFLFKRLKAWIIKRRNKYLKGIKIKDFEIMDANDELDLIFKVVFVIRIIFMLIFASLIFPIIFSFFPVTKPITYKLIGLVSDPALHFFYSVINYLPNLFTIVVIVYIVRIILRYLKLAALRIESGRLKINGFYPDWSKTTFELVRIVIIALAFVMLFPYLPGAQSDVFKGVSVFIGIIFSIGSTSVVGNLVAGLVLTYMRPFKIGDRIKIGDIEGEIVEKSPFVLRIKTPKNEYITLPNSNVLTSHIVNYNRSFDEGGVILFTEITIGYDIPWRNVHDLLLKAAEETEYLEKDPKPFVLQKSLEDHSVSYQINAYSKKPLYKDLIYSLLHQNIQDMFAEAGVEILSPKYVASRDGSKSTIPPTVHGKPNPAAEENKDDDKDSNTSE